MLWKGKFFQRVVLAIVDDHFSSRMYSAEHALKNRTIVPVESRNPAFEHRITLSRFSRHQCIYADLGRSDFSTQTQVCFYFYVFI